MKNKFTMLLAVSSIVSSVALVSVIDITPAYSQTKPSSVGATKKYIDKIGPLKVTAIAKKGTNNPTIITLEDRDSCRQSIGHPWEAACLAEDRAKGMLRTKWQVDCKGLFVLINNEYGTNLKHGIGPGGPSRFNQNSYAVFDYACGTNYSR